MYAISKFVKRTQINSFAKLLQLCLITLFLQTVTSVSALKIKGLKINYSFPLYRTLLYLFLEFILSVQQLLLYYILIFFNLFVMKERPPKPDVSWLTEHTWHTCCDLEVRISLMVIYCICSFLKMIEMSMKIVGKH